MHTSGLKHDFFMPSETVVLKCFSDRVKKEGFSARGAKKTVFLTSFSDRQKTSLCNRLIYLRLLDCTHLAEVDFNNYSVFVVVSRAQQVLVEIAC
jgi:hypothetical protein